MKKSQNVMRYLIFAVSVISALCCRSESEVLSDSALIARHYLETYPYITNNGDTIQLIRDPEVPAKVFRSDVEVNELYKHLYWPEEEIPWFIVFTLLIDKDGRIIEYQVLWAREYGGRAPMKQYAINAMKKWYPHAIVQPAYQYGTPVMSTTIIPIRFCKNFWLDENRRWWQYPEGIDKADAGPTIKRSEEY